MQYTPKHMTGRCRSGGDNTGVVAHAVPAGQWAALCGKEPGRLSAGWSEYIDDAVTCPRCLRKIEKMKEPKP